MKRIALGLLLGLVLASPALAQCGANRFNSPWVCIDATTDGNVLRRNGSGIGSVTMGSLDLSVAGTVGASILGTANGGTGRSSIGTGVGTALGTNVGTAGAFVVFNGAGGLPTSLDLTNAINLPIVGGGTGATTPQGAMAALKGVYILHQSAVASSVTGTTVETTLATITVPANAMGANGCLLITALKGGTGAAGNHQIRIKFGATTYYDSGATAGASYTNARHQVEICNRNLTNSQIGGWWANFNVSATAAITSAINTTASVDIVITGQLSNAADTFTLDMRRVQLMVP